MSIDEYTMLARLQGTNQRGMMKKTAGSIKPMVVQQHCRHMGMVCTHTGYRCGAHGYGVGVANPYGPYLWNPNVKQRGLCCPPIPTSQCTPSL